MKLRKPAKRELAKENSTKAGNKNAGIPIQPIKLGPAAPKSPKDERGLRIKLSIGKSKLPFHMVVDLFRDGQIDLAIQMVKKHSLDVNRCEGIELQDHGIVKQSLLHVASYCGSCKAIDVFVRDFGGNVEAVDQTFKGTSLCWAAFGHGFEACERLVFVYGSKLDVQNVYGNSCSDMVPATEDWIRLLKLETDEATHKMKYIMGRMARLDKAPEILGIGVPSLTTIRGKVDRLEYANKYLDEFMADVYRMVQTAKIRGSGHFQEMAEIETCISNYTPFGYQPPVLEPLPASPPKKIKIESTSQFANPRLFGASRMPSASLGSVNGLYIPRLVPSPMIFAEADAFQSIKVSSYISEEQLKAQRAPPVSQTVISKHRCRSIQVNPGIELLYVMIRNRGDNRFPLVFNNMNRVALVEKVVGADKAWNYRFNIKLHSGVNRIEIFATRLMDEARCVKAQDALKLVHVLIVVKLKE